MSVRQSFRISSHHRPSAKPSLHICTHLSVCRPLRPLRGSSVLPSFVSRLNSVSPSVRYLYATMAPSTRLVLVRPPARHPVRPSVYFRVHTSVRLNILPADRPIIHPPARPLSVCVRPPVRSPSLLRSIDPNARLATRPSVHPCFHPTIRSPVRPGGCPSVRLPFSSVRQCTISFVCSLVCLFVSVRFCPSICPTYAVFYSFRAPARLSVLPSVRSRTHSHFLYTGTH